MMRAALFSTLAAATVLGGCAHMNSRAIAYDSTGGDRLFVWGSNYSAGIGTNDGICAQAATTAKPPLPILPFSIFVRSASTMI